MTSCKLGSAMFFGPYVREGTREFCVVVLVIAWNILWQAVEPWFTVVLS